MPAIPAKPASTPVSGSSSSSADAARRHLVWVRCVTPTINTTPTQRLGDVQWPGWLTACHRLTPQLQRFGPDTALLDLGTCTDAEALAAVQALFTYLQSQSQSQSQRQQVTLRAAIAPSGLLAQFALLQAPAHESLTLLTATQAPDLLRETSIAALARLRLADHAIITSAALAQVFARLDGYGVRAVAHLAQLDEASLRRQFGARLGSFLLAVARGEDVLPFQPTPAPLRLHFRLRLKNPVSADCLVGSLKPFTLEVASALARRGLQGHTLELRLRWESGHEERVSRTLPQPIAGGSILQETVERLLTPIFQGEQVSQEDSVIHAGADGIADIRLILSHLVPLYPAQHAFWPQRTRRIAALHEFADTLTHRYGKPLLFRSLLTAPDAIFEQDRSHLAPMTADVADVAEGSGHPARPAADVADDPDMSADIPHGVHWW